MWQYYYPKVRRRTNNHGEYDNMFINVNKQISMYVPLSDDKHRFVRDNSKSALESETNSVQDKMQSEKISENFFSDKIFFRLNFVSD